MRIANCESGAANVRLLMWGATVLASMAAGAGLWHAVFCKSPAGEPAIVVRAEMTDPFREAEVVEDVPLPVDVPVLPSDEVERLREEYHRPDLVDLADVDVGAGHAPARRPQGDQTPDANPLEHPIATGPLPTIEQLIDAWVNGGRHGSLALAEWDLPRLEYGGKALNYLDREGLGLDIRANPRPLREWDPVGRIGFGALYNARREDFIERLEDFDRDDLELIGWADWSPARFANHWRPYGAVDATTGGNVRVHAGLYREFD